MHRERSEAFRTPLGDTVTVRRLCGTGRRTVEDVTMECPLELAEMPEDQRPGPHPYGRNWPTREERKHG